MQRDHPVAMIEIAEKTGDIIDVLQVIEEKRIPLGARHADSGFDVLSLRKWWAGRGIPASRSGLKTALELLDVPYSEMLLTKCSGLSLSDQYWVTPCESPQSWHDVNFYDNSFSEDVGRALFGEEVLSENLDLCSPCNTSNGFLQKHWWIADEKRILLKPESKIYQQEPCIDDYLKTCKAEGKAPEVAFKGSFNICLSPDLHKKLAIYAAAHKMSINKYIENTLENSPAVSVPV